MEAFEIILNAFLILVLGALMFGLLNKN